ncbi:DsbA family oxidoreductase [Leucobacter weissii]|uniref:DsbA family oxidoreductase n=1 Tax=Leucobacter weissii TaxID=1983706 RepID=A0A939MLK4_9MICO|nr:DsbA family oxidoreductase [Leucobacter weissii]MBO1902993.1 DsbA family oxidoreductase [Leucobacter weissii]
MSEKIRVDVWSDIACPWCYIGKHRFEEGVAVFRSEHPDVEVEIESHSYELAPDTPDDFSGSEIDFLSTHKGMPRAQVDQMLDQMTRLAASEGLVFDFARLKHANTRRAHRVLHLAKRRGLQSEVQERLFRAYFAEGAKLSDDETVVSLAVEAGLDSAEAREALASEELEAEVDRDNSRARMLGANGVPFFLFEQKFAVSGAQTAEVFADVLGRVRGLSEAAPAPQVDAS